MITDTFLSNLAKWTNGESATIPTHVGYSSTVITPDGTDTSIASEYTRTVVSGSRVLNQVSFSTTKSGAALSGDETINTMLLWNASSSGELLAEALVPSLIHTSSFDIETDWSITFRRSS